jgi:hypothetical protein
MALWEYRTYFAPDMAKLSELGAQGWELVTTFVADKAGRENGL